MGLLIPNRGRGILIDRTEFDFRGVYQYHAAREQNYQERHDHNESDNPHAARLGIHALLALTAGQRLVND
jgi:hypothetical protein